MDATLLCRTATSELYVRADGSIVKQSGVVAPPGNALGRREVDFYRYARQRSDRDLPVPRCSEASYDDGGGRLVLERACWRTPRVLSDEDALIVGDVIASDVVPALARSAHRTLTHADLHVGNVLFRTRDAAVEAVVIDWQLYEAGIGVLTSAHADRVLAAYRDVAAAVS